MVNLYKNIIAESDILDASGLGENTYFEIRNLKIKSNGKLIFYIELVLNFIMPKWLENKIKNNIKEKIKNIDKVEIEYIFLTKKNENTGQKALASTNCEKPFKRKNSKVIYGSKKEAKKVSICELRKEIDKEIPVLIEGMPYDLNIRKAKKKENLYVTSIYMGEEWHGICIKCFLKKEKMEAVREAFNAKDMLMVIGKVEFDDKFENDIVVKGSYIRRFKKETKKEEYDGDGRRVELHIHSKMSDKDGFNSIETIVMNAADWGQPAVAITDHGVVQGFPDAANVAKKLQKSGKDIKIIYGMEGYLYSDENSIEDDGSINVKKGPSHHIILLAKNSTGLKNLYKLVSYSHIKYFYKKPRLPRSIINAHREGIIIGSACEAGELYKAIMEGKTKEELLKIASFYDYLEIQPLGNNEFMISEGVVNSKEDLIKNNMLIVELADKLKIPVVATTDAHYEKQCDAIYRNLIMSSFGLTETNSNSLYMRTTKEMLDEFYYLGDRAKEVVIDNTNKIADMIEKISPVPEGRFPPKIKGAEERLKEACYKKAEMIYGNPLPDPIFERLNTELKAIIKNGYAVMYMAAKILIDKSLSDGYTVGSRGSVGSSFAATMAGITEVNPLKSHYICPKCKHFEIPKEDYACGFDMPKKNCPKCGSLMNRDGFDIPFATFLGFTGNKEPDIDLNFAGEYQNKAQKYVGKIFGEDKTFKAGTITTIANKTAYGYAMHYIDENQIAATKYDKELLKNGCIGVKSGTGQHPGGIIVVPEDKDIYDFCPIQRPANKKDENDTITTHFDFHKIDQNLLKLDILGHDVPSMFRQLEDLTGIKPIDIEISDKDSIKLFSSLEPLKIKNDKYMFNHGTYGIPEFGTNFVRNMLDEVCPKCVSDLVRISGFSHGTDVWKNNAEILLKEKIAKIDEVISCRDDIMNYLIKQGIDNENAFWIMEHVRKNKVLTDKELELMAQNGVPNWYVKSCETLQYMFPKAHAVAYVMSAIRMAWFKINYPIEFYAAVLTQKAESVNVRWIDDGINSVEKELKKLMKKPSHELTATEDNQLTVLELLYEMMSRGIEAEKPVLGISNPSKFIVNEGKLNFPFMTVTGVGKIAAESLTGAYEKKKFIAIDEIKKRTKLSNTNIDDMVSAGILNGIPKTTQISIADLM